MDIKIDSLDDISRSAEKFLKYTSEYKVIAFEAEMGTGKTTFISELCRALGSEDDVSSPTFAIVNEYSDSNGEPIYHFDCYRLEDLQEALDFGAEDYLNSGCRCFVEWPEIIEPILPENTLHVSIKENSDGSRTISF